MHKCRSHQVREAINCLRLVWGSHKPVLLPSAIQDFTVKFLTASQPCRASREIIRSIVVMRTLRLCWDVNMALLDSKPLQFFPVPQVLSV